LQTSNCVISYQFDEFKFPKQYLILVMGCRSVYSLLNLLLICTTVNIFVHM